MRTSIFLLTFFFINFCFSQYKLTGNIYDNETKEPLSFANVYLSNTINAIMCDVNGYFYFNKIKPGKHIIKVSYIVMKII